MTPTLGSSVRFGAAAPATVALPVTPAWGRTPTRLLVGCVPNDSPEDGPGGSRT